MSVSRTYCQTQREKPLKVCLRCKREWYMVDDICAECEDKYLLKRADANPNDTQGNYMGGYGD